MKKYMPSFVAGFGAGVLQIVPFIKSFACCLIVPFASFAAVYLDQKSKGFTDDKIEVSHGLRIGVFTGIFAALFASFFDIFITLITKSNDIISSFPELQRMINDFPLSDELKQQVIDMLSYVVNDLSEYGFSLIYFISVLINNFFVNIIFGMIGGIVGAQILNSRIQKFR